MMRVTRVRLVNFHNFVDETVDIDRGGHLFLLGDNGSGKTTVLDAVHYALSGGRLEFNAAARVGGNKNEGRTVQGIVLRQDFERGVQNDAGAIAYAAVELWDEATDRRLTVGVGTEATTMEARVSKWGFVVRRPVTEIPLVVERDGARFAATRECLRSELGGSDVFYRIGDYRAAVAGRLFGGPRAYDEVCRFWSMVKAYREIVAGARNFGTLFRRLLPAPDATVFGEIARSLRSLGDMDAALRDLDDQRGYVAGLIELAEQIDRQAEVASRCRWLACFRQQDELRRDIEVSLQRSAELARELERLGHEVDAADARVDEAETCVRAAEAKDADGVAQKLREAQAREAQARGDLAAKQRDAAAQQALADQAAGDRRDATAKLASLRESAREILGRAVDQASQMPGDLLRLRALSEAMSQGGPSHWNEQAAFATAEERGLMAIARSALDEKRARLARARDEREQVANELAALRRQKEERPKVANFTAAIRALEAEGISAVPVYELLEPTSSAPSEALASIEALAGDAQLASLVVAEGDRARAAQLVVERAPGVRVVVATSSVALPDWAGPLFRDHDAAATALGALAGALSQPADLGPVASPLQGVLEHRGAKFSADTTRPRLLGRAARQRAHQERVARTQAALSDATAVVERAAQVAQAAQQRLGKIEALAAAVAGATGAGLVGAQLTGDESERRLAREGELAEVAHGHAQAARQRAEDAASLVAVLAARAESMHLDKLQARIQELGAMAKSARERSRELQSRYGVCANDITLAARWRSEMEPRLAGMEKQLLRLADDVRRRAALPPAVADDDGVVEKYVRVEQRGDTFKSIANIEARLQDAERAIRDAASELLRDGARGVRNIQFAGRFGFVYDEIANRIVDRRDQSAAGLLADLDRTLAEQRSVISSKTRELMETLVVGGLARDLQGQVDTLEQLVKNINRLLGEIRFGKSTYQFRVAPTVERRALVDIVKRVSLLDPQSGAEFRGWVEDRLDELRATSDGEVPEVLDYRNWFDYSLRMTTSDSGGVDLTRSVRALGSGGEQGVPNYLLVLALGKLMFDTSGARLTPLLFDEAFYGIDAGRRDQLLCFATKLGLQLFVASPDQDGVTPSAQQATTLFIVKDDHGDVHMAPYHYWHREPRAQADLLTPPGSSEPAPDEAECRME